MKLQEDLVLMNNAMRSGRCFFIWLTDHRPFVLQQRGSMIHAHWFIQLPSRAVADTFLAPESAQRWEECRLRACAQSVQDRPSAGAELGQDPQSGQGSPSGTAGFTGKSQGSTFGFWGTAARFTHISDLRYNIYCKDNGYHKINWGNR